MKRKNSKIILGTAAVGLSIALGGCTGIKPSNNSVEENSAEEITEFEVFDAEENYNEVVYGPPADR